MYLDHIHKTVRLIKKNVCLDNGNCAFLLTEAGEKKNLSPERVLTSVFMRTVFIVIGLYVYAGVTKDTDRFENAVLLYDRIVEMLPDNP